MEIETIRLPNSERFPCTRRDVGRALGATGLRSVEFRHSLLGTRRYAHLAFEGDVVAHAGVLRRREVSWLYILPVRRDRYPDEAATDFRESVLDQLRTWYEAEFTKPETAVLATEELFVEWVRNAHKLVQVHFRD